MISQQDIDRGEVVKESGRTFLQMWKNPMHVRWRAFFVQYNNAPDECWWEYYAPNSKRWIVKGSLTQTLSERPRVGIDTVCFREKWPSPLFSQRGKVVAINDYAGFGDIQFPGGIQYGIDMKTICIV